MEDNSVEKKKEVSKFPTLEQIKDNYDFKYHMTLDGLGSVSSPVMDVQANIRSINEEDIKIGLYDRKPLVNNPNLTYLNSSHLRDAGKDFKTIETHYAKLHDGYQKKKMKISELKEIMDNQAKKWDKYSKNNNETIAELKETIIYLKKDKNALEDQLVDKSKEISNLKQAIEDKERNNRDLRFENTGLKETIKEQAAEIVELKSNIHAKDEQIDDLQKNGSFEENQNLRGKIITLEQDILFAKEEIVGGDRWQLKQQINLLKDENQRLNTENTNLTTGNTDKSHRITNLINENIRLSANSNVVNQSLNTDQFSNEETKLDNNKTNVSTKCVVYGAAVGVKKDRLRGIKYSINWFDHDNINERNEHTKKNLEDFLRTKASLGNNTIMDDFLKNCSKNYNCNALDIINGRGEPDSISSNIFGYEDKTPLMIAAENGHADCVQTLINYNANVNYLDRNNKTALDYAHKFWKKNKSSNVRQPLWENGAVPSSCCEVLPAGKTPVK